jgi:uncharacterized protein
MRRLTLVGPRHRRWRTLVPTTRRERRRGLLGRTELDSNEALLLERTRSVHTFGMRFPLTIAWLDDAGRVRALRRMRPGQIALPRWGARHVLECPEGADLRPGDLLRRV